MGWGIETLYLFYFLYHLFCLMLFHLNLLCAYMLILLIFCNQIFKYRTLTLFCKPMVRSVRNLLVKIIMFLMVCARCNHLNSRLLPKKTANEHTHSDGVTHYVEIIYTKRFGLKNKTNICDEANCNH